jgi:hypothetical protein
MAHSERGLGPCAATGVDETIGRMVKSRVRMLLVDDHEVVRDGVKSRINSQPRICFKT